MSLGWSELHALIGVPEGESRPDSFTGISSLDQAKTGEVSFLGNPRYQPQLATTKASVVLVPPGEFSAPETCHLITVDNPSASFSALIDYFQRASQPFIPGVSAGAHLAEDVELDPTAVSIAPGVVIESGAHIGNGTTISAGCVIGQNVTIGEDCLLHPNVTIREACRLGNRVIIQPGAVIGSDGYGFEFVDGRHQKVPQVGIVEIHDDVEIGANSCIDRARFGSTVIGEGTKIDNLVQVAHNVHTGKHCLLVGQCGIAGSTTLGNLVTIAAQTGVGGHLKLGDQVVVAAQGGVLKNLPEAGVYMGKPARPIAREQKKMAALARVPKLLEQVREMKKKLEELSGE